MLKGGKRHFVSSEINEKNYSELYGIIFYNIFLVNFKQVLTSRYISAKQSHFLLFLIDDFCFFLMSPSPFQQLNRKTKHFLKNIIFIKDKLKKNGRLQLIYVLVGQFTMSL